MKKIFIGIFLSVVSISIYSFDLTVDMSLNYDTEAQKKFYQYGMIDLGHKTQYIDFFWNFSVCNDHKYQPSHGDEFYFGYYFFMNKGGAAVSWKNIDLTFGRSALSDMVESPYSLFVSSQIIPALLLDFSYDDGFIFFSSRWTELNRNSTLYTLDRGWQYNTYGVSLGDFKFGFQDSVIYTGTSFDPEYFLNPLPGFFKQYTRISPGKPWQSGGNANSIMGFFVEWNPELIYAYGQILLDDFNANAILQPDGDQNPSKIAWSLGGSYEFNFGTIGFYHAGATKYTFQSYGSSSVDAKYGYSFYPDVTYSANGVTMPILLADNYLGYLNGENNISFLVDYKGVFFGVDIYSSLELSISGEKSPANPWHQYNFWTEDVPTGTKMLDFEKLEKKFVLTASAERALTELGLQNLSFKLSLRAGYIWNALEIVDTLPSDFTQIGYWQPSGNNKAVFSISLGGRYSYGL